jgi:hypothetical protein
LQISLIKVASFYTVLALAVGLIFKGSRECLIRAKL